MKYICREAVGEFKLQHKVHILTEKETDLLSFSTYEEDWLYQTEMFAQSRLVYAKIVIQANVVSGVM